MLPLEKLMRPGAGRMTAGRIPTRGGPGTKGAFPDAGAEVCVSAVGCSEIDGVASVGAEETMGGIVAGISDWGVPVAAD